jgi:hypothetical protein
MLPVLIPILAGLGGAIAGALARQPEVNRLKVQVKKLQAEVQRLQRVIQEQDRQIRELKIRYNALKAYHFTERMRQKSQLKGAVMFQYAFKEYMDLLVVQARENGYTLSEDERLFYNAFDRLVNNTQIAIEEKLLIREYIRSKYTHEIDQLIQPETSDIIDKVESVHVA